MSIESAKAFYSKMTTDEAFRTQLEMATTKEKRQQILQAVGYKFTQEEWQTAIAQIQDSNSTGIELNDTQLEAVSGGLPIIMPAYGGASLPHLQFDISDLVS